MPRGVYKRRSKREDILEAAAKIYAHHGFEGATIERMAEAAGVSKSLVLEHFGSKQELVKAVADFAVSESLERIREIDQTPSLTLRHREWLVHDLMAADRERWCLILGTVLVPSFEFQQRGEFSGFEEATARAALAHREELRDPTEQAARDYAHLAASLHISYVIDGREDKFRHGMKRLQDVFLLPEEGAEG
ncbi:MAG: TetR/AcrR family transcriptional regulator [Oscillospiraceae bacterium]|nr:TetR/AcrR family transcriptional regulator [Oscillospiraceae bacterium]